MTVYIIVVVVVVEEALKRKHRWDFMHGKELAEEMEAKGLSRHTDLGEARARLDRTRAYDYSDVEDEEDVPEFIGEARALPLSRHIRETPFFKIKGPVAKSKAKRRVKKMIIDPKIYNREMILTKGSTSMADLRDINEFTEDSAYYKTGTYDIVDNPSFEGMKSGKPDVYDWEDIVPKGLVSIEKGKIREARGVSAYHKARKVKKQKAKKRNILKNISKMIR